MKNQQFKKNTYSKKIMLFILFFLSSVAIKIQSQVVSSNSGKICAAPALALSANMAKKNLATKAAKNTDINIPILESFPGAPGVLYLDFDGEIVKNSEWNYGNEITATQQEWLTEDAIIKIWKAVADDFSPFNFNVTTSRAIYDATPIGKRQMCIFTSVDIAFPNAGGAASYDSFFNGSDAPCWVFHKTIQHSLGAAHMLGHTLGLHHHEISYNGKGMQEPYKGHNHNDWVPTMGNQHYKTIRQWNNGSFENVAKKQDDLAIISGDGPNVGYRIDDHGNTAGTATALKINVDGTLNLANKGIISKRTDRDVFSFTTDTTSTVLLKATVNENHPSLNTKLRLIANNGIVHQVEDPIGDLNAEIAITVAAGTYFLEVDGVGEGDLATGYSDYGSLGMYEISGKITSILENQKNTDVYVINAKGTTGNEKLRLLIGEKMVHEFEITTSFAEYKKTTTETGTIRVEFFNDATDLDVEIDFVEKNGKRFESEHQTINTGVWQNNSCGGTKSSLLNCNGYIEFATGGTTTNPTTNPTTRNGQLIADGTYQIQSNGNKQFIGAPDNRNVIEIGQKNTSAAYLWEFEHHGNDVYTITIKSTGNRLEVPYASKNNGTLVGVSDYSGAGGNLTWKVTENSGAYLLSPYHDLTKALDVRPGDDKVQIWSMDASNINQQWSIIPALGDKSVGISTNVTLYPNPVKDTLYIKGIADGATVQVFDLLGRQVLQTINTTNTGTISIDGSALKKGIYMAKVGLNTSTSIKFLKE